MSALEGFFAGVALTSIVASTGFKISAMLTSRLDQARRDLHVERERVFSRIMEQHRIIERLRSDEGDSVTLCCDNPDFEGPNNLVMVCGDWTNRVDRTFEAGTHLDALCAADAARTAGKAVML